MSAAVNLMKRHEALHGPMLMRGDLRVGFSVDMRAIFLLSIAPNGVAEVIGQIEADPEKPEQFGAYTNELPSSVDSELARLFSGAGVKTH